MVDVMRPEKGLREAARICLARLNYAHSTALKLGMAAAQAQTQVWQ